MMIPDVDSDVTENRGNESEEVPMKKISDMQVIFAGEKIQDITSLSANAVLILGQGSLYAYTISWSFLGAIFKGHFSFKAVLDDLVQSGGFLASCCAQSSHMSMSMVNKIQEDRSE